MKELLRDFKNGMLEEKGWPESLAAYKLSKAALNAYTRILARTHGSIMINCVCPGFVKTEINGQAGHLTVEQGGASPVRLALMPPHGSSPSGLFFSRNQVSPFWLINQFQKACLLGYLPVYIWAHHKQVLITETSVKLTYQNLRICTACKVVLCIT